MKTASMSALLLLAAAGVANAVSVRSVSADLSVSLKERPVMKIVRMLEDMKAELEKEKAEDEAVFESLDCWCKQNDKEKSQAIALGEAKMEDLKAAQGEFSAKIEELRVGLANTKEKLRKDKQALDESVAMRMKEAKEFHGEEKDMLGTIQSIKDALIVLERQNPSLTQLASVAKSLEGLKAMQMAKDTLGNDKMAVLKAFFQEATDSAHSSALRKIPGFQSYSPQSGQINGILKQMKEEFEANLATAQSEEKKSISDFQQLKAAKQAEIDAGKKQQMELEQEDAEFREKNEAAYEEFKDTQAQLALDQTFMMNLKKKCSATDEEYAKRTQSRLEEIAAVEDTIAMLNSDEAFSNFDSTVNSAASFIQVAQKSKDSDLRLRAAAALRRTGNADLAALAQAVQLDAFTKVKAAMDKMLAELEKQQSEEYAKFEQCNKDIDAAEDEIKVKTRTKSDLEEKLLQETNAIATLTQEIADLQKEELDMKVSLKQAGEDRKAQNGVYKQSVMDQRTAINILNKALARMKEFYGFIQQPGSASSPEPAKGKAYGKSAGAGGVVLILETIIKEATTEEQELDADENTAQADYATLVRDTAASIEAARVAIEEKSAALAETETDKSETQEALLANGVELEKLADLLHNQHVNCDYVIKYFDLRQQARKEEMDSIKDAKAILSGADFGK
mmetsp:Transcript_50570/g.110061  ORF Transcript_50570/g.110061 Transcript_50570/m.110061 type:complete len:679 (+) Transcript_50570:93-2129(+)